MKNTQQTRIWLGSLSKYNEGTLSGEWLDLPMPEEEIREKYNKYTNNGQNDFFLADWECPIHKAIGEYTSPFEANEIAERLESLDDREIKCVEFLMDNIGCTFAQALDSYEDVTFYEGMRLKEVAEEMVDAGCFGEIPTTLENYIDFEAIARDMSFDGYHYETDEGVFHYAA